ncbi:MAG: dihydrolipoamide acetyltransferase family protein [Polyangiaceae bacterium]
MARWEFKLPDIGEGVTEGEIVAWLCKPGDVLKEDAPMVEVMTDKATVTITSPKAGKILETHGSIGTVVQVHSVLVVFDLDGATGGASAEAPTNGVAHAKDEGPAATAVGDIRESLPGMGGPVAKTLAPAGAYFNAKPLATPATRRAARELSIELSHVPPTGPQGRVTKADVEAFAKRGAPPPTEKAVREEARPVSAAAPSMSRDAVKIAPLGDAGSATEERVPFAGMRRKIATKMAQSKHTAAHFTFVEECDAGELKKLRERLRGDAEKASVKLTFLPFFVKAVVAALKKHPVLNSALDESTNELVYRKVYNIGIAASTDAGLMVPVVKNADRKSILEIAKEIDRLGKDAKAGKSKPEDLQGSTFTITSLGAQGGLFATPIINFPEVGILGIHQMKEKPVVRDGQIVVGSVMLLSLSFDHRIVDGHVGAAFAYDIIGYLENPDRLFLEMA